MNSELVLYELNIQAQPDGSMKILTDWERIPKYVSALAIRVRN
jgi:hypothetical protein